MIQSTLIQNVSLVNEGQIQVTDVLIVGERIQEIGSNIPIRTGMQVTDGTGKFLLPGVIDGQVHFRDPGLTHKADLNSESKAALAGGVTSFIDMPNTRPNTLTLELLEEKYQLASQKSLANYGFLLGINGENLDEVLQWDTSGLLAITDDGLYFSGKGNILADRPDMLEKIFSNYKGLIAIHSEKEEVIEKNEETYREKYGEDVPVKYHPLIRSEQACYEASERAIALAEKHGARLHILHLSTAKETDLFRNDIPLSEKKITTEVSVHHLWFTDADYEQKGTLIKWNPAIKTKKDADGLLQALLDDRIDLITTDHAPHTLEEKQKPYFQSMSGAPLVQHSLVCLLEFYHQGKISLEKIVEKMCHNPAILYRIKDRGYIRKGYFADLVMIDLAQTWTVAKENILYKCGWSPLEGTTFHSQVVKTWVNGHLAYDEGTFDESILGKALEVK
ncbi:dihydroorotase [Algoriphagus sanaruensis]|uniref:Dihydroorotase n=1 Tax=Algoriphagus sanaruensis TaxID=1727163 RepID=A0A142ES24_9BACT|nr:dihydroorotase [Algoriphagus sanaruensis]AMQ57929.1 dihydroorotase [Algoriphagus sanaruensis]